MIFRDYRRWILFEAANVLDRAKRLRRPSLSSAGSHNLPNWEPPVDVFDLGDHVLVVAAMPGVEESTVEVTIEAGVLCIFGHRPFPAALSHADVRIMEIPWGRFVRNITLPSLRLSPERYELSNGCLNIRLLKD